jgi:anthranilate synthase/aminodeoxychorismate synthase-like glutamine amidotransferase
MKVLLIDNNDSFTYNIVDILHAIKSANVEVKLYEKVSADELSIYNHIIISPGPMTPADYPKFKDVISFCYDSNKPLLGICLGHQAIGEYFGGKLIHLTSVVHGQKKVIDIDNLSTIFHHLPKEIEVGLYHSWAIDFSTLPESLKSTGMSKDPYLMSFQHSQKNIFGVQFHPESFMTESGAQILKNFLSIGV